MLNLSLMRKKRHLDKDHEETVIQEVNDEEETPTVNKMSVLEIGFQLT